MLYVIGSICWVIIGALIGCFIAVWLIGVVTYTDMTMSDGRSVTEWLKELGEIWIEKHSK